MLREFLVVAARAALQWALASLLLANGAVFCLVAAASERLRLGPPCILCARIHRLLSSAAEGDERDALRLLLCGAHLAAVAAAGPELQTRRALDRGDGDGVSERKDGLQADDRSRVSGLETHRVVSIGSEICEQDHDTDDGNAGRAGSAGDGDGPLVSLFELAPIVARSQDDDEDHILHKATPPPELLSIDGGERLTVGQLLSLRAQRRELDALRAELDAERRARAAAEEYQRQLEEQGELDREAARLAMQLVHETEREKHALQQQLDACRVRAQLYGGGQDAGDGGSSQDMNGGGDNNNYQSLVDFLPGSVYSSSPDLANLLKLYTQTGNDGSHHHSATAVSMVMEEEEATVTITTGIESSGSDDPTAAIIAEPLHEKVNSCHIDTVTKAA